MTRQLLDYTQTLETRREAHASVKWAKAVLNDTAFTSADRDLARFQKASVEAATTANASALAAEHRQFVEVIEARTVVGRLGGAIAAPPFTTLPWADDDVEGDFVAEGSAAPFAKLSYSAATTSIAKIVVMVAVLLELARSTDPRALRLLEAKLTRSIRRTEDALLLDDSAAVAQERPAGLAYGLTPILGGSPANIGADLQQQWLEVRDGDAEKPHYVMSKRAAVHLRTFTAPDGTLLFPNLGPLGGDIMGVPVITSQAAGNRLFLIDSSCLAVVDEGLAIEGSDHASVLMTTDATMPGSLTSAYQTNARVLRLTRWLSWTLLAADAVGILELTDLNQSPS